MEIKIGNVYYDKGEKRLIIVDRGGTMDWWSVRCHDSGSTFPEHESYMEKNYILVCTEVELVGEKEDASLSDSDVIKEFSIRATKLVEAAINRIDKLNIFDDGESDKEESKLSCESKEKPKHIDPREHPLTPDMVGRVVLVDGNGARHVMVCYDPSEEKPISWGRDVAIKTNGDLDERPSRCDIDYYYYIA